MSRIVLASTDATVEDWIRNAFGGSLNGELRRFGHELKDWEEPGDALAQLLESGPDVVAFGSDVHRDTALKYARILDRDHPEVTVAFITSPTPKLWEQAMKAGVDLIIPADAGGDEVREELERALEAADRRREILGTADAASGRSNRVITILSPKGGSGKSVVATNLAVGLAQAAPGEVALVDLDVQFGDVAAALQLVPEHTIADAAGAAGDGLDLTRLKVFLTHHRPSDLYVLCAPESPVDGDQVSPEKASRLLNLLAQEFRYVVVDTGAGISEHTLAALDVSTDFLFVATMDVASVRGLRKEVEAVDQLGLVRQSRHFVLNRSDSRVGIQAPDVEATVGLRVDVALPSSRAVPLSFNEGQPLIQSDPRSPVARELLNLVGRFAELPAEQAPASSGGLFRFWRHS